MQVVVEQTADGVVAFGVAVVNGGSLGRVRAEQVVYFPSLWPLFGEQVGAGQLFEYPPGLILRDAGQARRRMQGDVRAGVQADEAEHPRGRRMQLPVGA